MKIFVISDHHFNHKNIIRYCNRPFSSVKQMNEVMIERWNNVVDKNDLVFHLGDFALGNRESIRKIRQRLNGTIILLKGNHDYKIDEDCGFIIVRGSIQLGNLILTHRPLQKVLDGFVNIHGHIHEKESWYGVNVSVDRTKFTPLEIKL